MESHGTDRYSYGADCMPFWRRCSMGNAKPVHETFIKIRAGQMMEAGGNEPLTRFVPEIAFCPL